MDYRGCGTTRRDRGKVRRKGQEMARITFVIEGQSPLLTHSPQGMFASAGAPKAAKGKTIPTPEEEAAMSTYRDADGRFVFPVIAPRNALLKAAKGYKVKGKRSSMFGLLAHIRPEQEFALILDGDGKPATSYAVDLRRVVTPSTRGAVLRARARFETWRLEFSLIYDEVLIPDPSILVTILADAGNQIGIGDYRPICGGWFGRFIVKEVR